MEIRTAIELFTMAAENHGHTTLQGNAKLANESYKIIHQAVEILRQHQSMKLLMNLLEHENISVQLWSATYLLPIEESIAIKTLTRISSLDGILAFNAKITLSEWQKGNMNI